MKIIGTEGLTTQQIDAELAQGAKFVVYPYCVSILVMTFKRASAIHYIRPGESASAKALPYVLISLFFGWWGFPWGLIWTPATLTTSLRGGKDVTQQLMAAIRQSVPAAKVLPAEEEIPTLTD